MRSIELLDPPLRVFYNAPKFLSFHRFQRVGACLNASHHERWLQKVCSMTLKAVYKWRGLLAALPVIVSIFCCFAEYENKIVIWPMGLLFFMTGWVIRLWTQKHLGYRLKIKRCVTTTGPYAVVRNPIYIANTLVIVGTVIMSEDLWMVPVAVLWCALLYALVVRYEEAHLAEKYGQEYVDYLLTVPRWVPRLAWPRGKAHFQSSARQIVLAEVYVLFILAAPLAKEFLIARFLE
jgi:protein-S-isoprenylcysteine O-methyltransferase Ste14